MHFSEGRRLFRGRSYFPEVNPSGGDYKTLIFAHKCGVDLQGIGAFVPSFTMVHGLTGSANPHAHFFRDFAKRTRLEELAHLRKAGAEAVPIEVDTAKKVSEDPAATSDEVIAMFESRNREVLAHEASHMAAAGAYALGGASYTYQTGPDGKQYAIGGQVSIDMSPVPGNPSATIMKMMAIRAAALSPADPSGQDVSVAAAAAQIEAQARAQLSQSKTSDSEPMMSGVASRYAQPASSSGAFINQVA